MTYPFDGTINDSVDQVFKFLNHKELSLATKVCKSWHFMANSRVHWKNLLGLITNYRHTTEHPKETYQKILDLQSNGYNDEKALQDIEYAKMVLLTPNLKLKASFYILSPQYNNPLDDRSFGEIISCHAEIIQLINKYSDLSARYLKYLNDFIGSINTYKQSSYSKLYYLIKTANPFLKEFLQDKNLTFSQLENELLSPEDEIYFSSLDQESSDTDSDTEMQLA